MDYINYALKKNNSNPFVKIPKEPSPRLLKN